MSGFTGDMQYCPRCQDERFVFECTVTDRTTWTCFECGYVIDVMFTDDEIEWDDEQ